MKEKDITLADFVYTVHCRIASEEKAEAWLAWLRDPHIDEVIEAGALSAQIVQMDDGPHSYEVRYVFESRAAFEAYERDHAPRLREGGLKLFPPEDGFEYRRSTGEIIQMMGW